LRTDPFIKQVSHGEFMVGLIAEDAGRNSDVLMRRLRAQLSHSDGIRGFMVTFLTTKPSNDTNAENHIIPNSLITAILEQIDRSDDANDLITLMCMNIVMPSAMKTQQASDELSQQSAYTANRAIRLLKDVLQHCKNDANQSSYKAIVEQCKAILAVASNSNWNENDICADTKQAFWHDFFVKWGYKSEQRFDIAESMRYVLQD
jgi:hypothetical protein